MWVLVRSRGGSNEYHNLCFEQKYKKYRNFLSEKFPFLVVKFSIYLNRHVFVMYMSRPYSKRVKNQLLQIIGLFPLHVSCVK